MVFQVESPLRFNPRTGVEWRQAFLPDMEDGIFRFIPALMNRIPATATKLFPV
jgi:hypothetical protein